MAVLNTQKWEEFYNPYKTKAKETAAASFDKQSTTVSDAYNAQIEEANTAYEQDYRENAVQKLINEREVAENMANLGLTDSGLNRTQQTAVQLSYANNKANIDKQKRTMVDTLTREMTAKLTNISVAKETELRGIDSTYAQLAAKSAQDEYETTQKYEAEIEKARIEAAKEQENSRLIYTYQGEEEDEGGNTVKNYLDSNGKVRNVGVGINPYTGTNNTASASKKKYGTYSNGYQPKGIVDRDGTDYGSLKNTGIETGMTGKPQFVRKTTQDGVTKYWVWYGEKNAYVEVNLSDTPDENGNYDIIPTNHWVYIA